jgi:uncharacterized protein YbjT (DUF2867 family)
MKALNIVVGATGQVGATLTSELKRMAIPVRGVIRDPNKHFDKTIETKTADVFDVDQVTAAFKGGTTVFLITPENPASDDIIGDTEQIVSNYREAVRRAGIKKIIGLSCIGAHHGGNTGNILMSRILEQGFHDVDVEKIFVRPSYYFSNWLGYMETVKQYGVIPSFFPEELKIEMHSPIDLAKFIANIIADRSPIKGNNIYELVGPQKYSSIEVASAFSKILNKKIAVQTIPKENWKETLLSAGFTENTASNLADMTQAVIDHKTNPERPNDTIKLPTSLQNYLQEQIGS